MNVRINNQAMELPQGASLADAVRLAGAAPPFAAALNLRFVPSSQYAQTALQQSVEFGHPYYWAPFTIVGDASGPLPNASARPADR